MAHHRHLLIAIDKKTKRLVEIGSVARGLECGCICPLCKQTLVARKGEDRIPHFAHYNGDSCEGARMTALHMLAQQIIEEEQEIMLPSYNGKYYQEVGKRIIFDNVVLEKTFEIQEKTFRPDCIGIKYDGNNQEHYLWIEIRVTHEVDTTKQAAIKEANISCIEIDLSDMLQTDYTKENVKKRLLELTQNKTWLNTPIYDKRNEINRIKHEQEQAERKRIQEQKKKEKEKACAALKEKVNRWRIDGNIETTKYLIEALIHFPFEERESYSGILLKNDIFDILVPNNYFFLFVDKLPRNNDGLNLFYTLLHFYWYRVNTIDGIQLRNKLRSLFTVDKIYLEELISLKIIHTLSNKSRYSYDYNAKEIYKKQIKHYLNNNQARKEVLMVSSVYYHHIIGSNAQSFGELTKEIIQYHPSIAESYLKIINSQKKHTNNYNIGDVDMRIELKELVDKQLPYKQEPANLILRELYSFAFKENESKLNVSSFLVQEDRIDEWQQLNERYQNS